MIDLLAYAALFAFVLALASIVRWLLRLIG
jgi:hypothetical protein